MKTLKEIVAAAAHNDGSLNDWIESAATSYAIERMEEVRRLAAQKAKHYGEFALSIEIDKIKISDLL